ncbi:MAG TPA: ketoacyl-ACP synthase III [Polyangiaceae bacterium]|nr:ketoacyl-ACP synthase III [Polyangiaceae bacterium]
MSIRQAYISGTGGHVPPQTVTNEDLRARFDMDLSHGVRAGIRERRYAAEGVGAGDLAVAACEGALESAGLRARDVDVIVMATLSGEGAFPGSALFLQRQLGVLGGDDSKTVAAMDIRDQAAGFLFALSAAVAMVRAGTAQHALVVGSEVQSALLDFSRRGSTVTPLFGDGAGAVVVSATDERRGIGSILLGTDARGADTFFVNLWHVNRRPYLPLVGGRESDARVAVDDLWPRLDYDAFVTAAAERIASELVALASAEGMKPRDLDLVVLQQTSAEVGKRVTDVLELAPERVLGNVSEYGDTGSASIPLALAKAERDGHLVRGMKVAMAAFGAGYVWGTALCEW